MRKNVRWSHVCMLGVLTAACDEPLPTCPGSDCRPPPFPLTQTSYVKPSSPTGGFGFSAAVSDDGNTFIVGAPWEGVPKPDAGDPDPLCFGGAYVFVRGQSGWTEQQHLRACVPTITSGFGSTVAISSDGNTVVVGAPLGDGAVLGSKTEGSIVPAGAVFVFARTGETWSQEAYLRGSPSGERRNFGGALALSGNGRVLAVASALDVGAVDVFERGGNSWQSVSSPEPWRGHPRWFGGSLSLSQTGDRLAVSADTEFAVYLREKDTWRLEPFQGFGDAARDTGGSVVSLSGEGTTLAVFHPRADALFDGDAHYQRTSVASAGVASVFRGGTSWTEVARISAHNAEPFGYLGTSCALSRDGRRLLLGSMFETYDGRGINNPGRQWSARGSGAAYLFEEFLGAWVERAYIKASNASAGDAFGTSVALSAHGETLIVAADREASNARTINGDEDDNSEFWTGAAYVFDHGSRLVVEPLVR